MSTIFAEQMSNDRHNTTMNYPVVSIVIPTFNRAHLLGLAINTVLSQTYRNFDLIIVDDASADNTEDIVNSFNDNRIRYCRHEKNRGGSAARNTGIKAARGEYIAFLDDDDEWLPRKLEQQVAKFSESSEKVGLIYCGYACVYQDRVVSEIIPKLKGSIYRETLQSCILGGPTAIVKRECFDKSGFFDEDLKACQDWDLWIRIAKLYDFDFVPEILAKYTLHGNQVSAGLNNRISAREILLDKYKDDLKAFPSVLSHHLQRLGSLYALADKRSEGLKFVRHAIQINPLNWKRYLHFLLLFFSSALYKKLLCRYGVQREGNIILYH
ncbi:MAG: glycosyltransferase [Deltaproteobacteria bacterium]|nr:glycosyltransferase [Deltaproteobacteria bacterium]